MKPTVPCRDEQRARASLDTVGVFNLITDERFFDTVEAHLPVHRERLYTPTQTLAMFVSQVLCDDASCQRVVDEHVASRAAHGMRIPSSSTGAYSDARQRLPLELVTALRDEVARVARRRCSVLAHEPPTFLIDGTGFSMPDTPGNQARFPQNGSQLDGCGFPEGRLVAKVCATTGVVTEARVSAAKGKGTGETTAMRAMTGVMTPGEVVIGDAVYENHFTWAALEQAGCFGIFEIGGSRTLPRRIPRQITIKRPGRPAWMTREEHAALPKHVQLRVVVSVHETCRDKYLITSLLDESRYPDETVLAMYARRWDIEVDFRSFKQALGGGVLGCKTPEMVTKELAVHVLGYNLIRLLMCEAAEAAGIEPRQISFRHAQQCWSAWVTARAPLDEAGWRALLARVAQRRVRNRPGRKEPRAIKRRPKPHRLLDLPRFEARMVRHSYERKGR